MHTLSSRALSLLVFLFVLVGCGLSGDEPAPTLVIAPTGEPTVVAQATHTPQPTATNEPTAIPPTPTATAEPVPEGVYLDVDDIDAVDYHEPLVVRFPEPMLVDSAEISLVPSARSAFEWAEDGKSLTIAPSISFSDDTTYTLYLINLQTAKGQAYGLADDIQFTTTAAPKIVERNPSTSTPFDLKNRFQLIFSQPMDQQSVEAALMSNRERDDWVIEWEDEQTVNVYATNIFNLGDSQKFSLPSGEVLSADGVPMRTTITFTFRIGDSLFRLRTPSRSKPLEPIQVNFIYDIDKEAALETIQVSADGFLVDGSAEIDESGNFLFVPDTRLPGSANVEISFTELLMTDGTILPSGSQTFTTPPVILNASPKNNGVGTHLPITIIFDREMDRVSVEENFTISPEIDGEFIWAENELNFVPSELFSPQTRYDISLSADIKGANDEWVLNEDYTWDFRTGQKQQLMTFGSGPNAQAVDSTGERIIHFQTQGVSYRDITFSLHELSIEQFLDRYSSGFRGVNGWEFKPISLENTDLVSEWKHPESAESNPNTRHVYKATIPNDVAPGFYILNGAVNDIDDQIMVILSQYAIAVKQAEGQITTWVTDAGGNAVANATVSVYARNGDLLAQGQSNGIGIYKTDLDIADPAPLIVLAQVGNDITASGLNHEWRTGSDGYFGWWGPIPTTEPMGAAVYTDRPIYRPGQTVNFKAIVRADDDAVLSLPTIGTPVTVRIRDTRNNVVQTTNYTTNEFGTINGRFTLGDGAMLGDYQVEVEALGGVVRQRFKVQDYRKPDYAVSVDLSAERVVAGDSLDVSFEANYFYGEPVSNATATVKLLRLNTYTYWTENGSKSYDSYYAYGSPTSLQLDENGAGAHSIETENKIFGGQTITWRSNVEAIPIIAQVNVNDGSFQDVASYQQLTIFSADEILSYDTGSFLQKPNEAFTINGRVVDIFDEPVSGRDVKLTVRRYGRTHSDFIDVNSDLFATTDASGNFALSVTIKEAGYYSLIGEITTDQGHAVNYRAWLYVNSRGSAWYGSPDEISIATDKSAYTPGEVATVIIETQFDGPALLTVERGTTRREQLVELTSPMTTLELPLEFNDAPNVYVSINAWQEIEDRDFNENTYQSIPDFTLHTAIVNVPVEVVDKRLKVEIFPNQDTYAPRDEATVGLRVTNEAGEPVSAEISLAVVDEAIFALSADLSKPLFDAFYHQRDHVVRTYDTYALQRWLGGGFGGGGGGGNGLGENPRSDFPDAALWLPTITTDENGWAEINIDLPDNLTSWRLTARATTVDTKVGEAFVNIITKQPIIVNPILPRSLTAGDTLNLSALVHNTGDEQVELNISMLSSGDTLNLQDGTDLVRTITLQPGERQIVGWHAVAQKAGEAPITVRATLDGDIVDAVRVTLPINPLAVPTITSDVGSFTNSYRTTINMPANALEISTVKVTLNRSIAGTMLEGLEDLTGYPYGCVEQTMSRALPNAVVGRAFRTLGVPNSTISADLPAKINTGLQKLYGFQHNDGGWGWWFDDDSHDYQTAWVLFGLASTAEAGYEVDPGVIERGATWLKENLTQMDPRTRAFALYALATAGHGELGITQRASEHVADYDAFAVAALALALHEMGDDERAQAEIAKLVDSAEITTNHVFWESNTLDMGYARKTMASSMRSTSFALSAFSRIAPESDLIPKMVQFVLDGRQSFGWGNTNETSFAILGLTDHLLATTFSDENAAIQYTILLNGEAIGNGTLGRSTPNVSLELTENDLLPGNNRISLEHNSPTALFYTIESRVFIGEAEVAAAGPVDVERTYQNTNRERAEDEYRQGDILKVTLAINPPQDASYVLIEDYLPAGFEALNENLNTSAYAGDGSERSDRQYKYNNKEVHGDKVTFFITELKRGEIKLVYYARVVTTGEFVAMPTFVEAMYDSTFWGRSNSNPITVVEGSN